MMAQSEKSTYQARTKTCAPVLKREQPFFVILSFVTLFFLFLSASVQQAKANQFISSSTPGMLMAKIKFEINSPDTGKLLAAKQMRIELQNRYGEEMIYVKTPMSSFDPQAGFAYSKKDRYKRPEDYPKSREGFISEKPKTYAEALARYTRSIYLLKASRSLNAKARARAHVMHCHKHAQELYKKEVAALKRAN